MKHLSFIALALAGACVAPPTPADPQAYRTPLERLGDKADARLSASVDAVCGSDAYCATMQRAAFERAEALRNRAKGLRYDGSALYDPWVVGPFQPLEMGQVIDDIIWKSRREAMTRDGRYDYVKAEAWASQAFEARGIRFVEQRRP